MLAAASRITFLPPASLYGPVMGDIGRGDVWAEHGCEVVKADIADATSLASAFRGAEGVFVLVPPNFDPAPRFS